MRHRLGIELLLGIERDQFESHRDFFLQIVVGGRNKYLINGVNAQNQRVHDLFQSVSLNVNNPHFLIMQVDKNVLTPCSFSHLHPLGLSSLL